MFLILATPGPQQLRKRTRWVSEDPRLANFLENVKLHESRILSGPEKGLGFGFKTAMMTLDAGRAVVAFSGKRCCSPRNRSFS